MEHYQASLQDFIFSLQRTKSKKRVGEKGIKNHQTLSQDSSHFSPAKTSQLLEDAGLITRDSKNHILTPYERLAVELPGLKYIKIRSWMKIEAIGTIF